jgi:hypothetical protein
MLSGIYPERVKMQIKSGNILKNHIVHSKFLIPSTRLNYMIRIIRDITRMLKSVTDICYFKPYLKQTYLFESYLIENTKIKNEVMMRGKYPF